MLAVERLSCTETLKASVILLHGYAASAAIQRGDGQAFVSIAQLHSMGSFLLSIFLLVVFSFYA